MKDAVTRGKVAEHVGEECLCLEMEAAGFVTITAFLEWKLGLHRHLWSHGLAGCGKMVLTSTILDHLHDARPDS